MFRAEWFDKEKVYTVLLVHSISATDVHISDATKPRTEPK